MLYVLPTLHLACCVQCWQRYIDLLRNMPFLHEHALKASIKSYHVLMLSEMLYMS